MTPSDYAILALAFIAAGCGVIGMIASIMELIVTRRAVQRGEKKHDPEHR